MGGPSSDEETALWYSMYKTIPLRSAHSIFVLLSVRYRRDTPTQFSLLLPQYPLASQLLYTNTAIMVILLTFLDDSPFVLVSQFLSIFPCMNAPCTQITKFPGRFERRELEQGHLHISAGIFKQSMGARNRVGIALSYWPARLHRLAELIPWNRFLGSIDV